MDASALLEGVIFYLCFIPVLTFHEFAHAWVASKCGDDTARNLGRVSLNPLVHMEMLGTVILPLMAIFLAMSNSALAGFIVGWGKPVPVNLNNLSNPRRDDTLIALAGPGMNFLLALILMGVVKVGVMLSGMSELAGMSRMLITLGTMLVTINLVLAFFNLLPIPPLDGSHVLRNVTNMSYETYFKMAQYGLLIVIVVLNIPGVRQMLVFLTNNTTLLLAKVYGLT